MIAKKREQEQEQANREANMAKRAAKQAVARALMVEELELVTSTNPEGYKGVLLFSGSIGKPYLAFCRERHLGWFSTAEEAALAYARYVGKERAAAEADAARRAAQALAQAEEEGLKPERSWHWTGYKGVIPVPGGYQAQISKGDEQHDLGTFNTAEEAALARARARAADADEAAACLRPPSDV